jgi:hypothetical protein
MQESSLPKKTVAIAYDFDGTLAPGNMQEYNFIPDLNMDKKEFWNEANRLAEKHDMDEILAYLWLMLTKAKEKNIPVLEKTFMQYGQKIGFFKGVETFFDRINQYVETKGLCVEHHIISSGIREMIKGTSIAHCFKNIFASGFLYNENGEACWPAVAVNYTNKTQFLFRINKGIHNTYDNTLINKIVPKDKKVVPFSNMIYIGDGETDVPAMKMVSMQGGYSIAVYHNEQKHTDILQHERAHYLIPADYSENAPLDHVIKNIIDKIASEQNLLSLRNV